LMRARDLLRMTVKEVKEIERQLWKEWEIANKVLKVLMEIEKEEE